MAVDYWPDEEGSIVDGLICGFCYADGAIAEGRIVTWGTSAASRVAVKASTAVGDGIRIALKDASGAGAIIPVAFSGIVKVTTGETLTIGLLLTSLSSVYVASLGTSDNLNLNEGASKCIGCLMQGGADDDGDEMLALLGGDGMSAGTY